MRQWAALGVLVCSGATAGAQVSPEWLRYWPVEEREAYAAYERDLNGVPTAASLLGTHQALASEPHVAGSDGDARQIERLAAMFRELGLETTIHEFWAYLPSPEAAELEIVAPDRVTLGLRERALPEDRFSANPEIGFAWNGYSGSGEVTARVVYANYGTKADFERLRELGVDCAGAIVIARYGENYRGYKAKFAQAAGAAGLIIYTDPGDSGYMKGIPYPEGGFANECCVQRGSILTLDQPGDPLTPGIEATRDAPRVDPAALALPAIPVQPVGYDAAREIMSRMTGAGVPEGWQGGLAFAYRLTGGEALRVRLKVDQPRAVRRSANVIARLPGAIWPDEAMIVGCHHDAWGYGAADPLSGTICLMESARSFAALARAGRPPARTVVFAAWGAEEFGIIGSTEWVEGNRDWLRERCVGYVNLDMASMGPDFGSGATPSIRRLVSEAAASVPQARAPERMVLDAWKTRAPGPLHPAEGSFGEMGGGSDHIGFVCQGGVPSCSLSGGGSKGWSYHSLYDSLVWYWKVVGDDYEPALMVTRMTNVVASRLAGAPLLPLDPARAAEETRRHLRDLSKVGIGAGLLRAGSAPDLAAEFEPLDRLAEAWLAFATEADTGAEAFVCAGPRGPAAWSGANRALLALDRLWLRDEGLPGRAWFKNLYVATDEDSGYAAWALPGLRRAIERRDRAELDTMVAAYAEHLARLRDAARELGGLLGRH